MQEDDYTAWEFIKPRKPSHTDNHARSAPTKDHGASSNSKHVRVDYAALPSRPEPSEFIEDPEEFPIKGSGKGDKEVKEAFFAGWSEVLDVCGLPSLDKIFGWVSPGLTVEEAEASLQDKFRQGEFRVSPFKLC